MRIYSIFSSIDGECNLYGQGRMTTFIRFSGCQLNCSFCDTVYANHIAKGKEMTVKEVMDEVKKYPADKVTITGGEPLMQPDGFYDLTKALYFKNYKVSVETNGSKDLIGYGVGCWVVDYKLPSSGMTDKMNLDVFAELSSGDYIKFVVKDRKDYEAATYMMTYFRGRNISAQPVFSPVHGVLDPNDLIKWLSDDKIGNAIINFQLHKIVGIKENQ